MCVHFHAHLCLDKSNTYHVNYQDSDDILYNVTDP